MSDTARWMKALHKERREHQDELNKVKIEYEAKLLQERSERQWLHDKLIDSQKRIRTLTYEIMKKEEVIDALSANLRGTQSIRRSAPKEETFTAGVASEIGMGSGDFIKHDIPV